MPISGRVTMEQVYNDVRAGFGPDLCRIIDMPGWSDIMVNPDCYDKGFVFVDSDTIREVPCRLCEKGIYGAALILASYWNQQVNNEKNQSLNVVIPRMNLRANFVMVPAVNRISLVMRKPNPVVISPEKMVEGGTVTESQMEFLREAIDSHKNIIFSGGTGCHAKGTRILMADGSERRIEDVAVGNLVMGDDGTPREVIELHRGREMMYRIIPKHGDAIVVNAGHYLPLTDADGREHIEIPVKDYIHMDERFRKGHFLYFCSGVDEFARMPEKLDIPPYVMGLLLLEGNLADTSQSFRCIIRNECVKEYRRWIEARGWKLLEMRHPHRNGYTDCLVLFDMGMHDRARREAGMEEYRNAFRRYDAWIEPWEIGHRRIPEAYRLAPAEDRMKLLAGIIDSRGTLSRRKHQYKIDMRSLEFADDLAFVARSLGFRASVKPRKAEDRDPVTGERIIIGSRVVIQGDLGRLPCRVSWNRYRPEDSRPEPFRNITEFTVEEAGEDDFYGITVTGNHLYLMRDFMVQRNSGKTTFANTLCTLIDRSERIICIEDVNELIFSQPNVLKVLVNRDYTYLDAIGDSLRQRPTRILIGECRFGNQALEMLKAWNTGHPGGITTIHANNTRDVFSRLDQLCGEVSVSSQMEMIKTAVDVVVQMDRLPKSNMRKVVDLLDVRNNRSID